jgi:hypothetical protein
MAIIYDFFTGEILANLPTINPETDKPAVNETTNSVTPETA